MEKGEEGELVAGEGRRCPMHEGSPCATHSPRVPQPARTNPGWESPHFLLSGGFLCCDLEKAPMHSRWLGKWALQSWKMWGLLTAVEMLRAAGSAPSCCLSFCSRNTSSAQGRIQLHQEFSLHTCWFAAELLEESRNLNPVKSIQVPKSDQSDPKGTMWGRAGAACTSLTALKSLPCVPVLRVHGSGQWKQRVLSPRRYLLHNEQL